MIPLIGLLIHGNPGTPQDFLKLQEYLSPSIQWHSVSKIDNKDRSTDFVVAYSFGAYQALDAIQKGHLKTKKLFLIAPFFKPKENLSFVARLLMSTPFLSDKIIEKKYSAWFQDFSQKTFSAADLDHPEIKNYLKRIDNPDLWKEVIRKKLYQESHPLSENILLPQSTYLILGEKDATTNNSQALQQIPVKGGQSLIIPNAGHAILITHANEIAGFIKEKL